MSPFSMSVCFFFLTVSDYFICMQTLTDSQKPHDILESTTNTDGWKLELERVLPQLKVTIKTGMKLFPVQNLYSSHSYLIYFYYLLVFHGITVQETVQIVSCKEIYILNRKPISLVLVMG
jgi:hypothetical protein